MGGIEDTTLISECTAGLGFVKKGSRLRHGSRRRGQTAQLLNVNRHEFLTHSGPNQR